MKVVVRWLVSLFMFVGSIISIIHFAPIAYEEMGLAQNLQRQGMPSSHQDGFTLLMCTLVVLSLYILVWSFCMFLKETSKVIKKAESIKRRTKKRQRLSTIPLKRKLLKVIKKLERLLEDNIQLSVILAVAISIGFVRMALIAVDSLGSAQELQRMGTPSSWQNTLAFLALAIVMAMLYIIVKCIFSIGKGISRDLQRARIMNKVIFAHASEQKILRNIVTQEIINMDGESDERREELERLLYELDINDLKDMQDMMNN